MIDSLHVTALPPVAVENVARDALDWLQLVGSLTVAPAVAVIAALVGAKEGGKRALQGAQIAMREEAALNRDALREQLKHRLRYVLPRLGSIGAAAATLEVPLGSRPDLMEEVCDLRASYERLSDSGVHLESADFDGRVRTFMTEAAIVARHALGDEEERARLEFELANGRSVSTVMPLVEQRLQGARNRMRAWSAEADRLLRELGEQ